jgi:IS5 family transposase
MRSQRTVQSSIFDLFAGHEIGRELKSISLWLDGCCSELVDLVAKDLGGDGVKPTGRPGLSAESVLGCAILKQHRQLTYEELAFHLEDSASFRAFGRLAVGWTPRKSVLHQTISAVRAETWEMINRAVLASARSEKVEKGDVVRVDSTVTAALMHEPSDSSLLWDAVRVMARMLKAADALTGGFKTPWRDRSRAAKRRAYAIQFTRGRPKRVQQYRELLKITRQMLADLEEAAVRLGTLASPKIRRWNEAFAGYRPLIEKVLSQTERRVLNGETVPAQQKIVSLFEPHADIILKGSRAAQYGHKLNLVSGKSGLILDLVIEAGNPADSDRLLPMLERHIDRFGCAPRQVAADGGYATGLNLMQAKARGVCDMAFNKKAGLRVEDMVRSRWVYRKLRNFRAGVEADISCLKRAFGLGRCTWRGLHRFKAYVWSSVFAYNLSLFARLRPT